MKRKVIKAINYIIAVAFIIGAGSLDQPDKTVPFALCAVSLAWFVLFMYANRDMVLKVPERYYR